MRRKIATLSLALLLVASMATTSVWADGVSPPQPIAWRQHVFSIPFRVNQPPDKSDAPIEVHLYVSEDQGKHWTLAERAGIEHDHFVFRAPHDGEYWFSLRTINARRQSLPAGPHTPGLRVLVDTIAPRLQISAAVGSAGEVQVHWQAVDPNLEANSLQVQYQSAPGGPWKVLEIGGPPTVSAQGTRVGKATWWPTDSEGEVTLRGEVRDRAGNRTISQTKVVLARSTPMPPTHQPTSPSSDLTWKPSQTGGVPSAQTASRAWPPDQRRSPNLGGTSNPSQDQRTVRSQPISSPGGGSFSTSTEPHSVNFRMVNSLRFELQYDVTSVGASGVGRVELWGTRDGGRTWSLYQVDHDNRSPVTVAVPNEGIYGFRIVVESGKGRHGPRPVDGDKPELTVGVDLTRPKARLVVAEPGTDRLIGHMVIRWEADDRNLARRPISLAFSPSPYGPWTPIASNLANSGSHAWPIPPNIPDRIHLRLDAVDTAGNRTTFITAQPAQIRRAEPQGRLMNVRPQIPAMP